MTTFLHPKALAASIGFALLGAALPAPALAADAATEKDTRSEAASTRSPYIVHFAESGLLRYRGEIDGIAATAPSTQGRRKLDLRSHAATTYLARLEAQRAVHLSEMSRALGRQLVPTHSYAITINGVAVELTQDEADEVAGLPGVRKVVRAREQQLHTYRGPEFISAPTIWDGSGVPGGIGTRGFGVVVGVVDTGANSSHPAFANDETCGFDSGNPKLLSAVDCSSSSGGLCNGPNPQANPRNGHGVHTASTAAGNVLTTAVDPPPALPPDAPFMSGVAPCASVRTYKVCPTNSCPGTAILAGIENAIADGVDVINFSISNGADPWDDGDSDRHFLDALEADIFVAASAGNTDGAGSDPVGAVNHLAPWVTTVAASTHSRNAAADGKLSVTGPGTPSPSLQNIPLMQGSGPNPGAAAALPIRRNPANAGGCTAGGGIPTGSMAGAIALIERGGCDFSEKIQNAENAGAAVAIVYNNSSGPFGMNVGSATLPAYSVAQDQGQALVAFIDSNAPNEAMADFAPGLLQGDVLAGFSLRGPSRLAGVTKPDITAPGVNIYAAMDSVTATQYGFMDGTSMASPHIAGAGALLRAAHPDWTPAEVKSALMLTASKEGHKEDLSTPWDADDVGSGRVDLSKAAKAGFVLDETYQNFLAANPAASGDPKTLNLPSLREMYCFGTCAWTRRLTATLPTPTNWTVTFDAPPGMELSADSTNFTLGAAQPSTATDTLFKDGFDPDAAPTKEIAITAKPTGALSETAFAEVVFTETNGLAPPMRIPVAIQGFGSTGGDLVDSGPVSIVVPAAGSGLYINWATGATGSVGSEVAGWDFNPYLAGTGKLTFFWGGVNDPANAGVAVDSNGQYAVLASGASVDAQSNWFRGTAQGATANWTAGVSNGYLGFRFANEAAGGRVNYGYAKITTRPPNGFPMTITRYVYNYTGGGVTTP